MYRTTTRDSGGIQQVLIASKPFQTHGAMHGAPGAADTLGMLPDEYRADARSADYVIYSYATPIMWRRPDGSWFEPDLKYSVTTTKHQHTARMAVKYL